MAKLQFDPLSFGDKSSSLVLKIVGPMAVLCALFCTLVFSLVRSGLGTNIDRAIGERAESVAPLVSEVVEVVPASERLNQVLAAYAANSRLAEILVVSDDPPRVIAATDNQFLGTSLWQLPEGTTLPEVRDAYAEQRPVQGNLGRGGLMQFVFPLNRATERAQAQVRKGLVIISVDPRLFAEEASRMTLQVGVLLVASFVILLTFTYCAIQRYVLRIVSELEERVTAEVSIQRFAPITPPSRDEIGGIALSINGLTALVLARAHQAEALMNSTPTGILAFTEGGLIVSSNQWLEELLDLPRAQLVGQRISTLTSQKESGVLTGFLDDFISTHAPQAGPRPITLRRSDGSDVKVRAELRRLELEGRRIVAAHITHDVMEVGTQDAPVILKPVESSESTAPPLPVKIEEPATVHSTVASSSSAPERAEPEESVHSAAPSTKTESEVAERAPENLDKRTVTLQRSSLEEAASPQSGRVPPIARGPFSLRTLLQEVSVEVKALAEASELDFHADVRGNVPDRVVSDAVLLKDILTSTAREAIPSFRLAAGVELTVRCELSTKNEAKIVFAYTSLAGKKRSSRGKTPPSTLRNVTNPAFSVECSAIAEKAALLGAAFQTKTRKKGSDVFELAVNFERVLDAEAEKVSESMEIPKEEIKAEESRVDLFRKNSSKWEQLLSENFAPEENVATEAPAAEEPKQETKPAESEWVAVGAPKRKPTPGKVQKGTVSIDRDELLRMEARELKAAQQEVARAAESTKEEEATRADPVLRKRPGAPTSISTNKPRVLLAIDDKALSRKEVLEKAGFEVVQVKRPKEATRILASRVFDVIVLDVTLPELNAWHVAKDIRHKEKKSGKHVPIIALFNDVDKDSENRAKQIGVDSCVSRSLDGEAFLEQVRGRLPTNTLNQ